MNAKSSRPSTPRPEIPNNSNNDPSSQQQQPSSDVGRPLNVADALSYLDAVKNQFQDNPDVYNKFLDIMKDFKSQVIDTPGVIQRVSALFHGNPELIQGFNTFLPLGYRIEISSDPLDPNTITVTTPQGTTTQNTGIISRPQGFIPQPPHLNQPQYQATNPPIQNSTAPPGSRSLTPHSYTIVHPQPTFDPVYSPGLQNTQTKAAASFLNGLNNNNKNYVEKEPPGEFNHAIQYLNKIKARYVDDQDTYKRFLDILQTYQKEQKHSPDPQVYVQVQILFKDSPELLAEFKEFLPEVALSASVATNVAILPTPKTWPQGDPSPPNVPAKKPVQANKRSRKRVQEKDTTPVPPPKPVHVRQNKKSKHHHAQDNERATFSPYVHSPPQSHAYTVPAPPQSHTHLTQTHALHPIPDYQSNPSAAKLIFFDRAKKSLESREVYEDFLKLLNLFNKEIIDVDMLVERTQVFLGTSELMDEFKLLLNFDDRDKLEKGPPGSIRTGPPELPSALPVDDGEGPSYRKLPPSETGLACSGRDQLCLSVLNDEWVSHPTWASEESKFLSHKKTIYEEALLKSEEERHEYHVQIEALTRTIAVLEPINSRIDEMTNDERANFRLNPDFGGSAMSIYHRIIKKVYNKDAGLEVIQTLQDSPSVAVPVVLNRLKQKDEEWRRSQREWSRAWKEVDSKNFYKSLDHQGINFKQNDKKNITSKWFVTDILTIKKQQIKKWERKGLKSFLRGSMEHQLEFSFKNIQVLNDTLKLVYFFLEHSHAQYSPPERRGVVKFLKAFVPILCMSSEAEFKAWPTSADSTMEEDIGLASAGQDAGAHSADGLRSGRRSATGTGSGHSMQSGGIPANDLRKKLLKTAQEKASKKEKDFLRPPSCGVGSRAASPSPGYRSPRTSSSRLGLEDETLDAHDIWIKEATSKPMLSDNSNLTTNSDKDRERPLFVNTTFYTLLRLLELVYSRLLMCHEIGTRYVVQKHAPLRSNPVAVSLGLDDPNGPASVLTQTMEHLGQPVAEDANVVYMYLLIACEKLFDNELDQGTFEEHMRWFFGTKAYTLFTIDKYIAALVKQVQTILSDNKCQELWSLLKSAQSSKNIAVQDIIRYRREAERHVNQDDHLYRLQWVRDSKCVRVSLCRSDEPSMQSDGTQLGRWREYVNTYVMTHPTEWLPVEGGKKEGPVFLRRCLREDEGIAPLIGDHMKIRVSIPSYKLVYERECEDMVWHDWGNELGRMQERARGRAEERRRAALLRI